MLNPCLAVLFFILFSIYEGAGVRFDVTVSCTIGVRHSMYLISMQIVPKFNNSSVRKGLHYFHFDSLLTRISIVVKELLQVSGT